MLSLRRAIIGTLEVPRYTHVVVLSRALITTSLCIRNDDAMRPGQLHLALPGAYRAGEAGSISSWRYRAIILCLLNSQATPD